MNQKLFRPAIAALGLAALAASVVACGGDDGENEPLQTAGSSSTVAASASPGATGSATASGSASPGATASAPAATADAEVQKVDACEFVTKAEAEALTGVTLNEGTPITQQNGTDPEVTIAVCTYIGVDGASDALLVYLRMGGNRDEMLGQYEAVLAQATDHVVVDGVGERAFWWPREAQLNGVAGDTWFVLKLVPTPEGDEAPAGAVELGQALATRLQER